MNEASTRKDASGLRLSADIGGTFTDTAVFDERTGKLAFGKALSTPHHLVEGIDAGVAKAGTTYDAVDLFLHGSTIAINTILERSGAKTALLITEGFRDIYDIGRINRPDCYNLHFTKHEPLVERAMTFEVKERTLADGEVERPLKDKEIVAFGKKFKQLGVDAAAILFLHCYQNPHHEARAKAILEKECPGLFVSASHEISQEYREFERCSTVAANAYVGPKVRRYIREIEANLKKSGFNGSFLVVQSTGGLYAAEQACTQCIQMLESGPAAGVIATRVLCETIGMGNAIAFDMGGTTAKAGVILDGEPLTTGSAFLGGYATALPVQIAMMDIFEVGTGGGSIARIEGGMLRVGPQSAGAQPGPACYGRGGTDPTVTDANIVLGRLAADRFLGGEMQLDIGAARTALKTKIADPLGLSLEAAAHGILRIAAISMSYAVKGVTTERGLDVGDFALVAYGGAGPLHAVDVARELAMRRVIIPNAPGVFSAFGMLFSDLRYDFTRTWFSRFDDVDFDEMEVAYWSLEESGRKVIAATGVPVRTIEIKRAADMRYVGQEHAVTVDLPGELFARRDHDGIKAAFDTQHLLRYSTSAPKERAELVSLRTTVTGVMYKPAANRLPHGEAKPAADASAGVRPVYFGEERGVMNTPVYVRAKLQAGNRIEGPALIEEAASTTVLNPSDMLEVDPFGNLMVTINGKAGG